MASNEAQPTAEVNGVSAESMVQACWAAGTSDEEKVCEDGFSYSLQCFKLKASTSCPLISRYSCDKTCAHPEFGVALRGTREEQLNYLESSGETCEQVIQQWLLATYPYASDREGVTFTYWTSRDDNELICRTTFNNVPLQYNTGTGSVCGTEPCECAQYKTCAHPDFGVALRGERQEIIHEGTSPISSETCQQLAWDWLLSTYPRASDREGVTVSAFVHLNDNEYSCRGAYQNVPLTYKTGTGPQCGEAPACHDVAIHEECRHPSHGEAPVIECGQEEVRTPGGTSLAQARAHAAQRWALLKGQGEPVFKQPPTCTSCVDTWPKDVNGCWPAETPASEKTCSEGYTYGLRCYRRMSSLLCPNGSPCRHPAHGEAPGTCGPEMYSTAPGTSLAQVYTEASQRWTALDGWGPVMFSVQPVCPSCTDVLPSEVSAGETPGRIEGSSSVTADGASSYSIPLWVPTGRAGMTPELQLRYHSRGGNGLMGVGWSLDGLSRVTRCNRTIAQDGEAETIQFDATDRFCLDGNRLVAVSGAYGAHFTEYRTENDIFAKIVSLNPDGQGPTTFEAYLKDGRILTFGGGPGSRVETKRVSITPVGDSDQSTQYTQDVRYAWAVSQIRDRSGNTIRFTYGTQVDALADFSFQQWPEEISYTGSTRPGAPPATRSVRFVYEDRPDVSEQFISGLKLSQRRRLSRIDVYGPNPTQPALLRSYRLWYTTPSISERSLLSGLRECDGAGVCKRPTHFGWSLGDTGFDDIPTDIVDLMRDASWVRAEGMWALHTPDLNGDGKDDLLYREFQKGSSGSSDIGHWWFRLSTGLGFGPRQDAGLPNDFFEGSAYSGRVADLNQDGRTDVFNMFYSSGEGMPRYRLYRSNPSGELNWDGADGESSTMWVSSGPPGLPSLYLADLNGDGLPEAIRSLHDPEQYLVWGYRLNTGGALGDYVRLPLRAISQSQAHTVDVDGSGRTALLTRDQDSGPYRYRYTALMLGAGNVLERKPTTLVESNQGHRRFWFLDVNADGLSDAVGVGTYGGNPYVQLNTGNGFSDAWTQQLDPQFELAPVDDWFMGRDPGIRITDFNGDGRQDLLVEQHIEGARGQWALLQAGDRQFRPSLLPIPLGDEGNYYGQKLSKLLDANGDGQTDLVQVVNGEVHLYLRRGIKPDLLTHITDGLQARVEFDYQPLSNPSVYSPPSTPPLPQARVTRGLWVVSKHRVDNGVQGLNSYLYSYVDGRTDLQGRGWLGFSSRTVKDWMGRTTTTDYGVGTRSGTMYPFAGRPIHEKSRITLGSGWTHIQERWTQYSVSTGGNGGTYFAWPNEVSDSFMEVAPGEREDDTPALRGLRVTLSYDTDGNLTYRHEEPFHLGMTTGDQRTWSATYDRWPGSWIIGRPSRIQLTSRTSSGAQVTRTTDYSYDAMTGLLDWEHVEPDDPKLRLDITYTRDIYGLATRITESDAEGKNRFTTLSYDNVDNTFPALVTNALGHRLELAYHSGLGVPVGERDINGVETRWRYDGFGRPRLEKRADGLQVSLGYGFDGNTGSTVTVRQSGGKEELFLYDRLDRQVGWEGRTFNGLKAYSRVHYDPFGRLVASYRPYSELEPAQATRFEYDELGRPLFERRPDNTYVEYSYAPQITRRWDAKRHYSYVTRDALGRVAESVQVSEGGEQSRTRVTYAPFDLPERVEQLRDQTVLHRTLLGYDRLGRRTSLVEPQGSSQYQQTFEYDAFGQLRRTVDSNGAPTLIERDRIGRILRTIDRQGETRFVWDTGVGNGRGQLASSISPDGVSTAYVYDELGRLRQSAWYIDDHAYLVDRSYDDIGRLDTLTYPGAPGHDRFQVRHTYTAHGDPQDVRDTASGHVYWLQEEGTASGLLKAERFGNGITSTRQYDPVRGVLRRIDTTRQATPVQALGYDFDANGNLSTRQDELANISESFGYDHLDRLTGWSVNAQGRRSVQSFRYDALGNLLGRGILEGDGIPLSLTYDTTQGYGPFAVTQSNWGSYTYDANGNQVTAPGRRVEYTPFNLPSRIERGSEVFTFAYGADQQRALKRSLSSGQATAYVEGLYEHRRGSGGAEHVFYIQGGGRPVAQVVWKEQAGTVTGESTFYLHEDHQGSVDTVTDASANVVERTKYDPFGGRADPTNPAREGTAALSGVRKGFTGHEQEDELGLINMRGRMYDPRIGRFLSRDPVVQFPLFGQSYNRYSYALNNPLRWTDPTGFSLNQLDFADHEGTLICQNSAACGEGARTVDGSGGKQAEVGHRTGRTDDNGSSPSAITEGQSQTDPADTSGEPKGPGKGKDSTTAILDGVQLALDVGGMLPGIGIAFDIANAGIHAARGNWGEAGLSLIGSVPGIGDAAKGLAMTAKVGGTAAVLAAVVHLANKAGDAAKGGGTLVNRIGGAAVENLRLKPGEVGLDPPGISVLLDVDPATAARQMKDAFPNATRLHESARTVGQSTIDRIRAAGFDVIPDPTKKFPNHGRIIHPDGAAGFCDSNLCRLSEAFSDVNL
ncbi:RHS repeat-associated core domain-containing protein [Cystobacter ferrugineus]|uniref:RHS repeat-associated core domain-containing protein n=1 Tax=Cystobacter ferrugineus TaxID=83449 RepID=UPI0016517311|nr:RHS repeat-associated core domain-containing protein [Cystobacter ferrugineus]